MSDDQPIDIPEDSPDVQRSPLPASGAEPKNP